jgi:hypothetical protein
MYIRFEIDDIDFRSGKPVGIFTVAYEMVRHQSLTTYQKNAIQELLDYFKKELPVPDKFSKSKNTNHNENTPGISWLKADAVDMVSRFWELKNIIEDLDGPIINVIKKEYVGKIVYEDQHQVVAIK